MRTIDSFKRLAGGSLSLAEPWHIKGIEADAEKKCKPASMLASVLGQGLPVLDAAAKLAPRPFERKNSRFAMPLEGCATLLLAGAPENMQIAAIIDRLPHFGEGLAVCGLQPAELGSCKQLSVRAQRALEKALLAQP